MSTNLTLRMVDVTAFTKRLDEAVACLNGDQAPLPGDPTTTADPTQWRTHYPTLNAACAEALEEGKEVIQPQGLKFSAKDMRDNGARLSDLEKARDRAVLVVEQINGDIDGCRQRMIHHTGQVTALARTREGDPTRDEAYQDQVRRLFGRVYGILDGVSQARIESLRGTRETSAHVRELEQTVSRNNMELRALRGDKITVEDARPMSAPKSARRPRRSRR